MALTDIAIRTKHKPKDKPFKVADDRGLFLLVVPSGGKLWRMKYRFAGKEKLLSFGSYPDVPLVRAREKRDEASCQRNLSGSGAEQESCSIDR